jgi:hypothetical protein
MFQFTKERIINSAKYDGLDVFQAEPGVLRIIPGDNFYKDSKLGKTSEIVETEYVAPAYEELTATVSLAGADAKSNIFRLSIVLKKVGEYQSDYMDATTYNHKQLWYEGKGATAAEVVADLENAIKNEKNQSANTYVDIKANGADLTITCKDYAQKLVSVEFQQIFTPLNSTTGYTTLTGAESYKTLQDLLKTGNLVVEGSVGFGTPRQLMKDHRLPTVANTNWLASHQDERPVPGGKYNQYQMTIETVRDNMGTSAVGQTVVSKTNHIYYILQGEPVDKFKAAIKTSGIKFAKIEKDLSTPEDTKEVVLP